jgi:hypothetical protein
MGRRRRGGLGGVKDRRCGGGAVGRKGKRSDQREMRWGRWKFLGKYAKNLHTLLSRDIDRIEMRNFPKMTMMMMVTKNKSKASSRYANENQMHYFFSFSFSPQCSPCYRTELV